MLSQLLNSGRSLVVRHHSHRQPLLRHPTTSRSVPPPRAVRHYSSTLQRHYSNPFRVLGIPPNSSLETAQKAFVKLAIQHHPDTNNKNNHEGDDDDASVQHFVRIRQAFERIRDGAKSDDDYDYKNSNNNNSDDEQQQQHPAASWTEQDFLQWFFEQTGLRFTLDQRRELVNLHRSRVSGGRYDGPSWEIARRLVTEQDAFFRRRYQQQQRGEHSFASSSSSSSSLSSLQRPPGGEKKNNSQDDSNPIRRKRRR
jgi:curved DNA-binding protein CbpA